MPALQWKNYQLFVHLSFSKRQPYAKFNVSPLQVSSTYDPTELSKATLSSLRGCAQTDHQE